MFPTTEETNKLFTALASSGAYKELVSVLESVVAYEKEQLSTVAVAALTKPELSSGAKIQLGRCFMMEDLVEYARKFVK